MALRLIYLSQYGPLEKNVAHACSRASTPLKHNREEGNCTLKMMVYYIDFENEISLLCQTPPVHISGTCILYKSVNRNRLSRTLFEQNYRCESEAAEPQLLQFCLWNSFMYHLKCNIIINLMPVYYCRFTPRPTKQNFN